LVDPPEYPMPENRGGNFTTKGGGNFNEYLREITFIIHHHLRHN